MSNPIGVKSAFDKDMAGIADVAEGIVGVVVGDGTMRTLGASVY